MLACSRIFFKSRSQMSESSLSFFKNSLSKPKKTRSSRRTRLQDFKTRYSGCLSKILIPVSRCPVIATCLTKTRLKSCSLLKNPQTLLNNKSPKQQIKRSRVEVRKSSTFKRVISSQASALSGRTSLRRVESRSNSWPSRSQTY